MKTLVSTSLASMVLTCFSITGQAAEPNVPAQSASAGVDVVLTSAGQLHGTVVGNDGKPLPNSIVKVLYQRSRVAEVRTNNHGKYTVGGLRTGVHTVQTDSNKQLCRFWSTDNAPPTARTSLVLSKDETVLRGQSSAGLFAGASPGMAFGAAAFAGTAASVYASSTGKTALAEAGNSQPSAPASP